MTCTPAQLEANRRNALLSTGPKTVEGKESSRRNALKHGLTGAGVVIPGEDEGEVARRVEGLTEELVPAGGMMAGLLVRRLAALTVRAERSVRHETAVTADRVRGASAVFDESRYVEIDSLFATLDQAPAASHRRLSRMPEGVDRLIQALRHLEISAAGLAATAIDVPDLADRLASLSGLEPEFAPRPATGADLIAAIQAEVARLEAHRLTLDLADLAQSRAEAGERALLDPGPEASRLRSYEAATERSIFRLVRDLGTLRDADAARAANRPESLVEQANAYARHLQAGGMRTPLGSFFEGGQLNLPLAPRGPFPVPNPADFRVGSPLGRSFTPPDHPQPPRPGV